MICVSVEEWRLKFPFKSAWNQWWLRSNLSNATFLFFVLPSNHQILALQLYSSNKSVLAKRSRVFRSISSSCSCSTLSSLRLLSSMNSSCIHSVCFSVACSRSHNALCRLSIDMSTRFGRLVLLTFKSFFSDKLIFSNTHKPFVHSSSRSLATVSPSRLSYCVWPFDRNQVDSRAPSQV